MMTRTTTTVTVETQRVINEDVNCAGCGEAIQPHVSRAVCDFTGRELNVGDHMHMSCYFTSLAHAIPGWVE